MENFIDRTYEDFQFVKEIIEDLKRPYPSLESSDFKISLDNFTFFKQYLRVEILDTLKIERANGFVYVIFYQTQSEVSLRRDGSNNAIHVSASVVIPLNQDFGKVFVKNETLSDRIREFFSPTELKIKNDTEFNRKYLILASDKSMAEQLFNNSFRSLLKSSSIGELILEVFQKVMLMGNEKSAGDADLEKFIKLGLEISAIQNGG